MNSYLWNTGETSQAIRSYNKGKFTVLVKNAIGCIAEDSINVTSDPDAVPNELFMPDAFTPNEDGVNDFFPENKYSNLSSPYNLKIYNRLHISCEHLHRQGGLSAKLTVHQLICFLF